MPSNHSLPTYVIPCERNNSDSIGSVWLRASDFGECYERPSDTQLYPCLVPVYNGRVLNISTKLMHASLSGISVKHYNGKCYRDINSWEREEYLDEEEADYTIGCGELYDGGLFGSEVKLSPISSVNNWKDRPVTREDNMEDFDDPSSHLPICMRQRINYRNSFWNIHRPELCKLTWPHKYVSTVTVTEHLHSHLVTHGSVCGDYHDEATRAQMLKNELNEYGKLKVVAYPRELPPDEKPFPLKPPGSPSYPNRTCPETPRCSGFPQRIPVTSESKFLSLSDDEDEIGGRSLHICKEEFCMTIGRHVRKPAIKKSISEVEDIYGEEVAAYPSGEEESGFFFFNWLQLEAEEDYEEALTETSTIDLEPVAMPEPCPPLGMNDFCRAVAKADFSDLRCHPDDF
ncbi:hypothetical protein RUM43_014595 [Polyplax serrata]|uniref:Uncharacterized protein n=1 Tax=Polyplax serrata TaxID=468196 RepID=A0AAN8S3J4_POLSC